MKKHSCGYVLWNVYRKESLDSVQVESALRLWPSDERLSDSLCQMELLQCLLTLGYSQYVTLNITEPLLPPLFLLVSEATYKAAREATAVLCSTNLTVVQKSGVQHNQQHTRFLVSATGLLYSLINTFSSDWHLFLFTTSPI